MFKLILVTNLIELSFYIIKMNRIQFKCLDLVLLYS